MEKRQILVELHRMASCRLFSEPRWVPDVDTCGEIRRKLEEWGLKERVSATDWIVTRLGHELDVNLMMVFAGFWGDGDILYWLEQYGLIDHAEVFRILDHPDFDEHSEEILRPIVQRAYRDYYAGDARLN